MEIMAEISNLLLPNVIQILSTIGLYGLFNSGCNYILYKKNNHKIAISLDKINTIKLPSIKSECNKDELRCLVKAMEINFSKDNLACLYKNLNNLKLVKTSRNFSLMKGSYNYKSNTIKINNEIALPHEFLHMCSACSDENNSQLGFEINQDKFKFGYGLNEGYTELLARRYFKSKPHKSYNSQVKVASLLESLFSNPREMEELYLNHDLEGLIKKLSDFMGYDKVIDLINKIDLAHSLKIQGSIFAANVFAEIESLLIKHNNKEVKDKVSNLTKLYLMTKNK